MKIRSIAISTFLSTATLCGEALANSIYTGDFYNAQLECGPLRSGQDLVDKDFSVKIVLYNDNGSLRAVRHLKSSPARELFEGTMDAEGRLTISGEGAFDDPSRHHWKYDLQGVLEKSGDSVLTGSMRVTETGATRECRLTLDAENSRELLRFALRHEPREPKATGRRVGLKPDTAWSAKRAGTNAEGTDNLASDQKETGLPAKSPPPEGIKSSKVTTELDTTQTRKSARTAFDALSRLTDFPAACVNVKNLGPLSNWPKGWARENRDPFSGRYAASDVCKSIQECLPSLSVRLKPIVDYLRNRPQLYTALKREAAPSPIMNVDTAIETLNSRVDLSVNDCSLFVTMLDSLMARSGADPGHAGIPAPFEYLQSASQDLISDLQKEHGVRDQWYSDWLPYAKHYGRAADLSAVARAYEAAFSGPDIEPLLVAAQKFDQEISAANDFKATLLQQGAKLAELSERLADLAQRIGQPPLSKLIEPDESTRAGALKVEVDNLAKTPSPERGDVAAQLSQFETAAKQFRDEVVTAQDRFDAMSKQSAVLVGLSGRLRDLAKQANQEPVATLVKPNEFAAIEKLEGDIDNLAREPVPERGDVSDQITQIESATSAFENDLKTAEDKAAANAREAQQKAASLAAAKMNADLRAKGEVYAQESGTTWEIKRTKNEMTDKIATTAVSVQEPAENVQAEITASCPNDSAVIFSVLITDDNGKPTVTIPTDEQNRMSITIRRNNDQPLSWRVESSQISDGFFNKLTIGGMLLKPTADQITSQHEIGLLETDTSKDPVLKQTLLQLGQMAVGGPTALDRNTIWRSLIQIDSSAGPLLFKIPVYADAIQNVISGCSSS